ncbi:MAG: hypothetical protein FWF10_01180 [Clostridiales bacterium]|nr:hypothetical protein [Clostridiales bacterium]
MRKTLPFICILLCLSFFLSAAMACGGAPGSVSVMGSGFATVVPTPKATPEPAPTPEPTQEDWLWAYIDTLTTEEKLGQLCMFGFSGGDTISDTFVELLQTRHIGNVILFGTNIDRNAPDGGFALCKQLTEAIHETSLSDIPFLVSIDLEGGVVLRFTWPERPASAATLGEKDDPELARETFAFVGRGLVSAGINIDLAPVLDVAEDPSSTFMGRRIISSSAEVTANIGAACIQGLHEGGCLAVAKHFPGHGATPEDSHIVMPAVYRSLEEMRDYELIPFAACVQSADAVMTAHILYPEVDGDIATVSKVWITDILRGELGFEGFVISDDFRMEGLSTEYSIETAAVQFILAGGDMILCGPRHELQTRIMDALCEAAADGRISTERLNESVFRILRAKMRVTDFDPQAALQP